MIKTLSLALVFFFPFAAHADFIGKVIEVSDGDTITVQVRQKQKRIRFSQIDAPESKQAFGQKSRQNLSFIHGKSVYVQENSIDRYGRTLGTVYLINNGKTPNLTLSNSINYKQVKDGYAWAYREYLKNNELLSLEAAARKQKIGLWSDPNPIYPSKYRNK